MFQEKQTPQKDTQPGRPWEAAIPSSSCHVTGALLSLPSRINIGIDIPTGTDPSILRAAGLINLVFPCDLQNHPVIARIPRE